MLRESEKLEKQIEILEAELQKFPEGKLISTSNGSGSKWYYNDGHETRYLSKKERKLAEQLAQKKYVKIQLEALQHEKRAIEFYLKHHDSKAYQKEQSFINSKQYKELLSPIFTPTQKEYCSWINEPYERNKLYPENLIHKTHSGIYVRSKSEALIDMFLFKNKIPFRYECMLELDGMYVYPDFTIRHPKTGEIYYWEHFGMMDNPVYSKKAGLKLQTYISNGIIPSIQLITTYETKEKPLNAEQVEEIVGHYFL